MGNALGIYLPPTELYAPRTVQVTKTIDGVQICVREFVPFDDVELNEKVLLFSHGNADNLRTCAAYCQWLADQLHIRVFAYDYIGYGLSGPGSPSEVNMQASITAAYDYVKHHHKLSNIVLVGKSLGSVPSIWLCSRQREIEGLVLISPIASGVRVLVDSAYVPRAWQKTLDTFFADSIHRVKDIECPLLCVHGLQDRVVPIRNSYDLVRKMSHDRVRTMFVKAEHNDIELNHGQQFLEEMRRFLSDIINNNNMSTPYSP